MIDSLYPEDTLVIVDTLERYVDSFGRIVQRKMPGRTDGIVFYSFQEEFTATPISNTMQLPLVEAANSGVYTATFEGDVINTAMANTLDGTAIFRHAKFSQDSHQVDRLIWRKVRT